MKRFALLLSFLSTLSLPVSSQHSEPVLVQTSGSGTTTYEPVNGFDYSHHTNYAMNIRSLTAKWRLRSLMGEPVVSGVFKWEAGKGTPTDYLDYRDYVLLECSPKKSTGYLVYIALKPTVPKAGEGFGFNTPGSPSWKDVFCTRSGESMTTKIPGFDATTAREIWKNGFYVTGVSLCRIGGNDGIHQSDEQEKKLFELQKFSQEKSQEKYKAMCNPYRCFLKRDSDTVYTGRVKVIAELNPYFKDAGIRITSVNNESGDVISQVHSPEEEVPVDEGWNTIYIEIIFRDYTLHDQLKVFYKKKEPVRKVLLSDDFNDGQLKECWENTGYNSEYTGVSETNGYLLIRQGGEHTRSYIRTKPLQVDVSRKLILEFTSKMRRSGSCKDSWIKINDHKIRCRKNCDVPERVRLEWDLLTGEIVCRNEGEVICSDKQPFYVSTDGLVQPEFSCAFFEKWEIDDVVIYQE